MGNSSGKEQGEGRHGPRRSVTDPSGGQVHMAESSSTAQPTHQIYSSRTGRSSRPDLSSFLGINSSAERELTGLESRRETKQEREKRKAEKERVARAKERERSMREEHVDGGYLVTLGTYTGTEDYNKGVVRQLMIERRIAPFWRGLNDFCESWTENQLVAVAQGRLLPAPDAIPEHDIKHTTGPDAGGTSIQPIPTTIETLTVPISSRAQSFNSDISSNASPLSANFPAGGTSAPASSSLGSALSRGRAKTIASLTGVSKGSQVDLTPREVNLPNDPYVNGQPMEAILYKDARECSICLLYYPPYSNKTRCCDQPICSECFVQIKRHDPHPPEHPDPAVPRLPEDNITANGPDDELVSEPAKCPFCNQPEFGITYGPPPFRRGLTYANSASPHPLKSTTSAMSSTSSIASGLSGNELFPPANANRRRTTSVSANDPIVITTDRIRPEWHQKLAAARAHTARRSAAATALHTAAYLMGNRGHESDPRSFGAFGRRSILRRTSGAESPSGGTGSSQMNMLALMTERYAAQAASRGEPGPSGEEDSMDAPARGSSRRARADDIEEMMLMEAIRLSLAEDAERRKREEKEFKKDAKKKEKENKKADKIVRRQGSLTNSPNGSSLGLGSSKGQYLQDEPSSSVGKGKSVQQADFDSSNTSSSSWTADPQSHLERARQQILPESGLSTSPYNSTPHRPSHLRTLSNVSSSASSIDDSAPASIRTGIPEPDSPEAPSQGRTVAIPRVASDPTHYLSGTPPGGGAGLEPMFNFRSLAAMVGDDEKMKDVGLSADSNYQPGHQRGESSTSVNFGELHDLPESTQSGTGGSEAQRHA